MGWKNNLRSEIFFLFTLTLLVSFSACGPNLFNDCPFGEPYCGTTFPLNTTQTTEFGPAWADVAVSSSDFIPCYGPFALCAQATCLPNAETNTSDCPCMELFGLNFVTAPGILNQEVYDETIAFCGDNSENCRLPNQAPVCQSLNQKTFYSSPLTARVSTFSLFSSDPTSTGTNCQDQPGLYAGCMASACFGPEVFNSIDGFYFLTCECPNFDGPFNLGEENLSCDISPEAYSAAYFPNIEQGTFPEFPTNQSCFPDAGIVGENAFTCPLWETGTSLPPDSNVDCDQVCEEYTACTRGAGIQLGFTCDATLGSTSNKDLVDEACLGLENCDQGETFKAEWATGCSDCAFALCGCTPNSITQEVITQLNDDQRLEGATPQCDVNGLLCGN